MKERESSARDTTPKRASFSFAPGGSAAVSIWRINYYQIKLLVKESNKWLHNQKLREFKTSLQAYRVTGYSAQSFAPFFGWNAGPRYLTVVGK